MADDIVQNYDNLKHPAQFQDGQENGYRPSPKYPKDFQTVEFPELAGAGNATTLAHYQAFFFVGRKERDKDGKPTGPDKAGNQELNPTHLKELFENIYDNHTHFTMKMDANALTMPTQEFAKKLGDAGDDKEQVAEQIDIIKKFIKSGGISTTAEQVIREKNPELHDEAVIAQKTKDFLSDHFHLEGVKIDTPLKQAVWEVEVKGKHSEYLEGMQHYYKDGKWDGSWQLGSEPELKELEAKGHQGAAQIRSAVREMDEMKSVPITPELVNLDKGEAPEKVQDDKKRSADNAMDAHVQDIAQQLRLAGLNPSAYEAPGKPYIGGALSDSTREVG